MRGSNARLTAEPAFPVHRPGMGEGLDTAFDGLAGMLAAGFSGDPAIGFTGAGAIWGLAMGATAFACTGVAKVVAGVATAVPTVVICCAGKA